LLICSRERILSPTTVLVLTRMKWFAHRKTLKLAVILVSVLGAGITYVSLQPDELARYKAKLAASGEELSLLRLSSYSKEAADYQQQLSDASARLQYSPISPADIGLMTKPTNGFTRLAWTRSTPTTPTKGTWEDFSSQMDGSEPALAELRRLLGSPVRGNTYDPADPLRVVSTFDLISRRRAAQTLAAAVVNELHRQRLEAALTNLHALIALARLRDEGGMLVNYMIHAAIAGLAVSATWESLQAPGWTDAQLAYLQSAWQPLDLVSGFGRTVEMERAFGVVFYDVFRTNAALRGDMLKSFGGGSGLIGTLHKNLYLPIWATTWSKGDELRFLEQMQSLIEGVRRDTTNGNYHGLRDTFAEAMRDIKAPQTAFKRFRFPVASMVIPNWEKAATTLLRNETQRQMALAAIALKRHQLKHGRLPVDLAALTPEFLAAPPVDHLGGRLLGYQRLSDYRFTLRSVGNNQLDDLGSDDDLIWPEPAVTPATGSEVRD
jgi:hypothetical protein